MIHSGSPAAAVESTRARAPREFFCPLSGRVMLDPVIVASGCTYERAHILQWLRAPGPQAATCPVTGAALPHAQVVPNIALKELIVTWLASHAASGTTTSSATNVSTRGRSSSFSISISRGGESHGGHGGNSPAGRRGVSFQSPPAALEKPFTVSSPRRCPSPSLPDSPTSSAASPSPSPSSAFSPTIRPAEDATSTRTPFPPLPFPSRASCLFSPSSSSSSASTSPPPLSSSAHASPSSAAGFPRSTSSSPAFASSPHPCAAPSAGPKFPPPVSASPKSRESALNSNGNQQSNCRVPAGRNLNAQSASAVKPTAPPAGQPSVVRQPSKLPGSSSSLTASGPASCVLWSPGCGSSSDSSSSAGNISESNKSACLLQSSEDAVSPRGPPSLLHERKHEETQKHLEQQQQPQLLQQQQQYQQVKVNNQITSSEAATSQAPTEGIPEDKGSCESKPAAAASARGTPSVPAGGPRGGQPSKQASTPARQPQRVAAPPQQLQSGRSEGRLPSTHLRASGVALGGGPKESGSSQPVGCEGARRRAPAAAAAATRAAAARGRAGGRGAGRGRGMSSGSGGCKSHVQLSLQVGAPSLGVWSITGASPGARGTASRGGCAGIMAAQADAAASAGSSTPRAQGAAGVPAGEEEGKAGRREGVSVKNREGESSPSKVDDSCCVAPNGSTKAPGQVIERQMGGQASMQTPALRADNKQSAGQPNGSKQLQQSQLRKAVLSSSSLQQQQQPPPPPVARPAFLPPPLTCPSLPSSAPRPPPLHTRSTSIGTPMSTRPPLSRDPSSPSLNSSSSLSLSLSPPDKKLSHYQAPNESLSGGRGRGVRPLVLGKAGLTGAGNLQSGKAGGVNEEVVVVDTEPMQQGKRAVNTGRGEQGRGVNGGAAWVGNATNFARGSAAAAATSGNGAGRLLSASTKVSPCNGTPHVLSRSLSAPLSALRVVPPNVPHLHPSYLLPSTSSDYLQNQQHHTHTHRNNQHISPQQQQQQQRRRSPSHVIVTSMSPGVRPLRPGAPSPHSGSQASKAGRARPGEGAGSAVEQGVASEQFSGGSGCEEAPVERLEQGGLGGVQARMLRSSRSSNALLPSPTPATLLHKRCSLPARSNSLVRPLPGLLEGAGAVRKGTGAVREEEGTGGCAAGGDGGGLKGGADRSSGGGGCENVMLGKEGELEPEGEGEGEETVDEDRLVHDGAQQLVDLVCNETTTMEIKAATVKALLLLVTEHRNGGYAAWECGAVPALLSLARGHNEAIRKPRARTIQNNCEILVHASGDMGAEAGAAAAVAADIARILTCLVGDAQLCADDTIMHGVAEAGIGMLGSRVQGMDAHAMGLLNCLLRWPCGRKAIADVGGSAAALVEVLEGPCVRARGAAVKVMRDLVVGGFLSAVALVGEGALPPLARITLCLGEKYSGEVMETGCDERELVKNARALLFLLKESVWQGKADANDDSI